MPTVAIEIDYVASDLAGLSTVGYELFDADYTPIGSRVTAGVTNPIDSVYTTAPDGVSLSDEGRTYIRWTTAVGENEQWDYYDPPAGGGADPDDGEPAYLSLVTFKAQAGITGDDDDDEYTALLLGIEAAVAAYLGYDPAADSAVDVILSAHGEPELPLPGPLASVTAVYENADAGGDIAAFTSDTLLAANTDYYHKPGSGVLVRLNGVWPVRHRREVGRLAGNLSRSDGSVRVVGVANYTPALRAATVAGYAEAAAWYRIRGQGNSFASSESLNGYSISRAQLPAASQAGAARFLSPAAELSLRPFRRTRIAGL